MERIEVEVFSEATNAAIVRMPGRKYPGVVIQGDSLSILYWHAGKVLSLARSSGVHDLVDGAEWLTELLSKYLQHYEAVLHHHQIPLPYVATWAEDQE